LQESIKLTEEIPVALEKRGQVQERPSEKAIKTNFRGGDLTRGDLRAEQRQVNVVHLEDVKEIIRPVVLAGLSRYQEVFLLAFLVGSEATRQLVSIQGVLRECLPGPLE
jgi:repressor of nif and glnA expression